MDNPDLSIPLLEADSSSSKSKWVIAVVVVIVIGAVIFLAVKGGKSSNQKATTMKPPQAHHPRPMNKPATSPPSRISYLPTSAEAHPLPVNAPEPAPFDVYSGREQTFAEYIPGPQYALAYRQPANEVKVSVIDCQSSDMFNEIVLNNKKEVVCAFTSKTCGHCQQMKPEFEKAAGQSPIPFMIVEQSAAGDKLLQSYNIRGFPTVLRFRDGLPVAEFKNMPRTAENFIKFAS